MGELASTDTRSMSSASQTTLTLAYSAASMSSNVSTASNMIKSGLYKDERDTTRRRDGKLLLARVTSPVRMEWSRSRGRRHREGLRGGS
jgi:hypothetical protein